MSTFCKSWNLIATKESWSTALYCWFNDEQTPKWGSLCCEGNSYFLGSLCCEKDSHMFLGFIVLWWRVVLVFEVHCVMISLYVCLVVICRVQKKPCLCCLCPLTFRIDNTKKMWVCTRLYLTVYYDWWRQVVKPLLYDFVLVLLLIFFLLPICLNFLSVKNYEILHCDVIELYYTSKSENYLIYIYINYVHSTVGPAFILMFLV